MNKVRDLGFAFKWHFYAYNRGDIRWFVSWSSISPSAVVEDTLAIYFGVFSHLGEFFWSAVTFIRLSTFEQLFDNFSMSFKIGSLKGCVTIPIKLEPIQAIKN